MLRVTFLRRLDLSRYCFCLGLLVISLPASAEAPKMVAGKSLAEHAKLVSSENRVVRLRAIRSVGAFGDAAASELRAALAHEDRAVKYIAAVELGRIGGETLRLAKPELRKLAADKASLGLRLGAAYALCCGGDAEDYLPVMIEALQYPERGMVCSAAELLGNLGDKAESALPSLEMVYEQHRPGVKGGDYHRGGAAMNAIRKIKGQ